MEAPHFVNSRRVFEQSKDCKILHVQNWQLSAFLTLFKTFLFFVCCATSFISSLCLFLDNRNKMIDAHSCPCISVQTELCNQSKQTSHVLFPFVLFANVLDTWQTVSFCVTVSRIGSIALRTDIYGSSVQQVVTAVGGLPTIWAGMARMLFLSFEAGSMVWWTWPWQSGHVIVLSVECEDRMRVYFDFICAREYKYNLLG